MEATVCNRNCWVLAAIAGVVVLLFTAGIGELGFLGGLFLGLMTCGLLGSLLVWLVCEGQPEPLRTVAPLADEAGLVCARPPVAPAPAQEARPTAAPANRMPIVAGHVPEAKPASAPAAVQEPVAVAEVPAPAAAVAAPASGKVAAKGKGRAKADDLRRIKGIGPKLAERLRKNGVTRFEQIAGWDARTVADQAKRLGRMGARIEADDWVGQARILASGGETPHSRAVDRGEAT